MLCVVLANLIQYADSLTFIYKNDSTKIDICKSNVLIFNIKRYGGDMFHSTVEHKGLLPLFGLEDDDEIHRYAAVNLTEMTDEIAFIKSQSGFVTKFFDKVVTHLMIMDIQYICDFDKTTCTVIHRADGVEYMRFDGKNVTIHSNYHQYINASEEDLKNYAKGNGTDVLMRNTTILKNKWSTICKNIVKLDNVSANNFTFNIHPTVDILECRMDSKVPLLYTLKLHSPRTKDTFSTSFDFHHLVTVSSYINLNDRLNPNGTCIITSSTGWSVKLQYDGDVAPIYKFDLYQSTVVENIIVYNVKYVIAVSLIMIFAMLVPMGLGILITNGKVRHCITKCLYYTPHQVYFVRSDDDANVFIIDSDTC